MSWQLDEFKRGNLRKSQIGGFAWQLPSRDQSGAPASLPQAVLDFKGGGKAKGDTTKKRKASSEGEPSCSEDSDMGYELVEEGEDAYLLESSSKRRLKLARLGRKSTPYQIYWAHGRVAIGGGNKGDDTPAYCDNLFKETFGSDAKPASETDVKGKKRRTDAVKGGADSAGRPMTLKGMVSTSGWLIS